ALAGKDPGADVALEFLDQHISTHRPGADEPAVAGDAPRLWPETLFPLQRSIACGEAIDKAVVRTEQHPIVRDGGRQSHRPLSGEGPALAAGVGIETVDAILGRRAEVDMIANANRVKRLIVDNDLVEVVLAVPEVVLRFLGPGWG